MATTIAVNGRIDPLGDLKKYDTPRYHARGPMTLRVDRVVDVGGNPIGGTFELRIGLRRLSDGIQNVSSASWFQNQMGQTRGLVHIGPYTATTPPNIIPAGNYAVNARLVPSQVWHGGVPVRWYGSLTI